MNVRLAVCALTLLAASVPVSGAGIVIPSAGACPDTATLGSMSGSGCTVGAFTFFNFTLQAFPTLQPGSATQVAGPNDVLIDFPDSALWQVGFFSGLFDVQAGDRVQYVIGYTIDPPPPILGRFDLDLFTETPVNPGVAVIQAAVCAGGIFGVQACTDVGAPNFQPNPYLLQVYHLGLPTGNVLTAFTEFENTVNLLDVRILIDLDARLGGSSQIGGIGTTVGQIPEPGTFALLGAGLGAVVLMRRRK